MVSRIGSKLYSRTYSPSPCRTSTIPSACNALTASLTELRPTPSSAARRVSGGSESPGPKRCSRMYSFTYFRMASDRTGPRNDLSRSSCTRLHPLTANRNHDRITVIRYQTSHVSHHSFRPLYAISGGLSKPVQAVARRRQPRPTKSVSRSDSGTLTCVAKGAGG